MKIGWGVVALAVYLAAAAAILDSAAVWWVVAGLAVLAIATAAVLPAPVPEEMIIGGRNHIDCRKR